MGTQRLPTASTCPHSCPSWPATLTCCGWLTPPHHGNHGNTSPWILYICLGVNVCVCVCVCVCRLGHGVFMLCLESVFWKLAGQRLRYEAVMGKPSLLTYQHAELVIRQETANQGWDRPVTNLYAIGYCLSVGLLSVSM